MPGRAHAFLPLALVLLAGGFVASSRAQEPSAGDPGVRVFEPAWFRAAAPANAYDMVLRLPGFTVVDADPDVRGYSGALGNVLVDGVRPASKREDTAQVLKRIPAHSVVRIELIRVAEGGVDMAGHALLANVVRAAEPAPEMAVQVGVALASDGWSAPVGSFDYGRHWGDRALELALSHDAGPDEDGGDGDLVVRAPDGTVLEQADTEDRSIARLDEASLHWRQPWAGGRLNLNASAREESQSFDSRVLTTLPEPGREDVAERERLRLAEFGARYSRLLSGNTTFTAMASQQHGWLDAEETARSDDGDERFSEDTRTGESLASVGLAWARSETLSLNGSLELAYNDLRSRAALVEDGEIVDLPGSHVRVQERRAEAAVSATWQANDDWQFDGGLRVEGSRLDQSGDRSLSRRFTYAKPHLGFNRDIGERQKVRASLSREVGQLDFGDFVASASLATGDVSAGNVRLEPDKTWRALLSWQHEFGQDGSLQLGWTHDRIDDVVDRVPVLSDDGELFDAPGNIGRGRRDALSLELGSSLAALGAPSLRFDATVTWQRSRVRDPSTGEWRGISEEKPVEGELSLVQTLPAHRLSWGLGLDLSERETSYRYDRVATETEGASWELFVERRFEHGWRLRAELHDPQGQSVRERRENHDGLRGVAPVEDIETRRHRAPGLLLLTLRRDIGG